MTYNRVDSICLQAHRRGIVRRQYYRIETWNVNKTKQHVKIKRKTNNKQKSNQRRIARLNNLSALNICIGYSVFIQSKRIELLLPKWTTKMTKKKHSDRASNYTAVQPLDFEPQNAKERGHLTFRLLLNLIGTEHLACPSIHVQFHSILLRL